ncbi:MAG: hypothetical protein JSR80_06880 [Verrucomicrobia bacterium]|nr:hypothetical protein [Verrucomicrobiota bacterium]
MQKAEACFEKSCGRVINTPFRGVMLGTVLGTLLTIGAIKCWRRMGRQVTRITLIGGGGALGAYLVYKGSKRYQFQQNPLKFQENEQKRAGLIEQPALVGDKLQSLAQAVEQRWPDQYEQVAVVVHVEVERSNMITIASQGCILQEINRAEGIKKLLESVEVPGNGIPKIVMLVSFQNKNGQYSYIRGEWQGGQATVTEGQRKSDPSDSNTANMVANLFADLKMLTPLMEEEWLSKIPENCGTITISLEGEINTTQDNGGTQKKHQFSMQPDQKSQEIKKNVMDFIALRSRTDSNPANVSNVKCVINYSGSEGIPAGYLYREITPAGKVSSEQSGEGSYQSN